jgi:D-ala D-ala ligase C-terminus
MEYVLITERCPLTSSFDYVPSNARITLLTRLTHHRLSAEQREAFYKIVVLDNFNFSTVLHAIKTNVTHLNRIKLLVHEDMTYLLAARIKEALKLPGYRLHSLLPFCDKVVSKQRLQGSNILYPKYFKFDGASYQNGPAKYLKQIQQALKFPVIAKPNVLAASIGLQKLETIEALQQWCLAYVNQFSDKSYTQDQAIEFEIEEFIDTSENDLFHCDSIIQHGQVIFTQVCQYTFPCMEVLHGKPLGSMLLHVNEAGYQALQNLPRQVIQAFARHAPIPDGVMHLEAFLNRKLGTVTFLETQLRPPGGDVKSVYRYSCDIDLEEVHFKLQMGIPVDAEKIIPRRPYSAWFFFPTANGIVDTLLLPKIKSKIHKMKYSIHTGKKIQLPSSLLMQEHTALNLLISNSNYSELKEDFEYLKFFTPFVLTT